MKIDVVCEVSHNHTFSTEWTTDSTAHWHVCTAEDCDIENYATCGVAGAAYGEHADSNGDGKCDTCQYVLVPAVKIGDTVYASLADAIDAAKDGDVITLQQDFTGAGLFFPENTFADKGIIIDLNAYTYTLDEGSDVDAHNGIVLAPGNKLTIQNGTVRTAAEPKQEVYYLIAPIQSTVILEDVSVDGTNLSLLQGLFSYTISGDNAKIDLLGSTSVTTKAAEKYYAFDVYNNDTVVTVDTTGSITGTVEVTGGTFIHKNGAFNSSILYDSGTVNSPVYKAFINTDKVCRTLEDAITTANGKTVTLLADGLSYALTAGQTISVNKNGKTDFTVTAPAGYYAIETEGNVSTYTAVKPNNKASLTIDKNIVTNFKLDLDTYAKGEKVDVDALTVKATYNTNSNVNYTDGVQTLDVTAALDKIDGKYVFSIAQAPAQIAETIKVEIYNGETLLDTIECCGKIYADQLMAKTAAELSIGEEQLGKFKAFCVAMVNYGDCAQKYFKCGKAVITEEDGDTYDCTLPTEVKGAKFSVSGSDIKAKSLSFMSLADSALRIYYDGDVTSAVVDNGKTVTVNKEKKYIEVSGLVAAELDDAFTITVNGSTTITANALAYVYFTIGTSDTVLKNLCASIALYNTAADAAFAN